MTPALLQLADPLGHRRLGEADHLRDSSQLRRPAVALEQLKEVVVDGVHGALTL